MPYNLKIPGQIKERDLWAIEALARLVPPGGVVVEVGSFLGLSSYAWAKSVHPSVTVYCIDPWQGYESAAEIFKKRYGVDYNLENFNNFVKNCPNIVPLKGFSPQDFSNWEKPIDLYFDDADHQNPGFNENIVFWSKFIKPDGIICGHAYGEKFPDVIAEVSKLSQVYQVEPVIVESIWSLPVDGNLARLKNVAEINGIHGYQYQWQFNEYPKLVNPGDLLQISGKLKNCSGRDWQIFVDDTEIIKIGVKVYEGDRKERKLEPRESLRIDKLTDGATVEFDFVLDTREVARGKIRLEFDLVAEGWYWFKNRGAKPETLEVNVLPRTAGNLIKAGNQLKRKGKLAEAIVEYYKAIELNPHFYWSYYNLGDALAKKGYLSEAIGEYKKAIDLNSNSIWFYHNLGVALHKQGKVDEAINCFQKAKELVELKDDLTREKYKHLMDSFLIKPRRGLTGKSTYLSKIFTDLINPNHVNYILELGSRDGIDAVYLSKYYLCKVDAFECSPECIKVCLNNLKDSPSINLITKAAWDKNEVIPFYVPTNGNAGAASCFEETGNYPFEKYNPYQVMVEAIRLDSYLTRSPDLICMDLQGAELNALTGLGRFLKGVKYIITEIEVKPLYKNQCLFDDVVEFLKEWGFELNKYVPVKNVAKDWFGDALFVNKALVKNPPVALERVTNSELSSVVDLQLSERKIFSQNGEAGVISKIFEVIGTTNKYYVEFGVGNAVECNTRNLRENFGWSGLLMDGGYEDREIGLYKEFITAENINHLFERYNVPKKFDLLSIDIDFNDFYIWKSLDEVYQPRVVVIEHNASHSPTEDKVVKYDPNFIWDGTNYFGASIRALYNLGKFQGYSLIYAESMGINLFFVKDSILSKIDETFKNVNNPLLIYRLPKYGRGPNGGHRHDDKNREYITSEEILFGDADLNSLPNT